MKKHFKFTKVSLDKLPLPEKGRVMYHDTQITSLKLRITHTGTKTFSVFRRVDRKPERFTLGKYPLMTVEQARIEANKINGLIASGINPNDKKREGRAELTLKGMFDIYLENHSKLYKKSWETDVMNYKNHLSHWDNKQLSRITKKDVQGLHRKIGKEKPITSNRVMALLKVMFNKAIQWDYFDKTNPVIVRHYKEKSRERFLQAHELQAFFDAVADEQNHAMRDYVLISLLTGARQANVLAMKWEEIDFNRKEWRIPETKTGDSHTLPLTKEVIEVLENRKGIDSSPFVLSGTGKTGHFSYPKAGWERIKKKAGIKDLRMHDLRRSLGSWQATTGASLTIIGKTLAHKNVSTTAIYARLNNDPVRESMEKATSAMLNAGKEKAEVVPIKKKGSQ